MGNESQKQKEIAEIQLRIQHLQDTDQISISDKIAIAKQALEILEKDKELKKRPKEGKVQ